MHESGLIQPLVDRVIELAREGGARRVLRVTLRLGALCQLSGPHLAEHFRAATAGTIAAGAALELVTCNDPLAATAQSLVLESVEVES
jgi:Zn finger protein HypA/HybF involved in hydrogenase expression